jgi:hypothetical protein
MPEIAVGHKEITNFLRCTWRTVQRHKKNDPGFRSLFRVHPITRKPMIIIHEVIDYMIEWNKLKGKMS